MAEQASQLTYITDDAILARIRQAESGVIDLEYRAGAIRRELADLRRLIDPQSEAA